MVTKKGINFSKTLIGWYEINKRDLPWRNTSNPYLVWLSEIILQQTRVDQGLPYYNRFVARFPTVFDLASAREEDVLKLWEGLGYYSRARNLHFTAREIVASHRGLFPGSKDGLMQLKGIGEYTASAIASFVFEEACPVVDGNVFRVVSRYCGIEIPADSPEGKKVYYKKALALMDKNRPGIYNQAIMEFGALHCKPMNPDCVNCPLKKQCVAFRNGQVDRYPVKVKKIIPAERFFNYFVIEHNGSVLIRKRTGRDIWQHLYDFPLAEDNKNYSKKTILNSPLLKSLGRNHKLRIVAVSKVYKHHLTHQTIYARFFRLNSGHPVFFENFPGEYTVAGINTLKQYVLPRLIQHYLKDYLYE